MTSDVREDPTPPRPDLSLKTWLLAGSMVLSTGCHAAITEEAIRTDAPETLTESRPVVSPQSQQNNRDHQASHRSPSLPPTADRTRPSAPDFRPDTETFDGLVFIRISAGAFVMGTDNPPVPDRYGGCETPAHPVTLTRDVLIGRTEVTVGQFRHFVADTGYRSTAEVSGTGCNSLNLETGAVQQLPETTWQTPGFTQSDDHPVVCVSWSDAVAFCDWLSFRHKRRFRLPTEAEWEYACRAGTNTTFSTGDSSATLQGCANVADQALRHLFPGTQNHADWNDGFAFTAPVASFAPSSFGLFDMHGNVGEWCRDWFEATWYSDSPLQNPAGPTGPTAWHVVRGGSWFNAGISCRSTGRHDGIATCASTTNGFRVLLEAP